jgi:serine/threonine protein kinase
MDPERWRQIDRVLEAAIEREPAERAAFLDEACGGDEALRREVEALLAADERPGDFMVAPLTTAGFFRFMGSTRPENRAAEQLIVETVVDGKYRIDGLLGRGGMGAVYRAWHLQLERPVALKVIRGELHEDLPTAERFRREAVAVARLRHPHIVAVYDYGVAAAAGAYIVMELLEGRSLR